MVMVMWQVEDSHIYCGLSDGRVVAFSLMVSDSGLQQSFDSSCVHDTSASRLRPVLSLAVTHGRVYYGDGSVNVKVIDCSQGWTCHQLRQVLTNTNKCNVFIFLSEINYYHYYYYYCFMAIILDNLC